MKEPRPASRPIHGPNGPKRFGIARDSVFGSQRLSAVLHPASLSFALIGLLLTTFAASALYRSQKEALASQFNANLLAVHQMVEKQLTDVEHLLHTGRAFFAASGMSGAVSESDSWGSFFQDIEIGDRYPGLRGIGYAPVVANDQLDRFEDSLRLGGIEGFEVRSTGEHPLYAPVLLYETVSGESGERGDGVVGLDLMADPSVGSALARARDSGLFSVSAVAPLREEFGPETTSVFLVCLPLYAEGGQADTIAKRRASVRGHLFAFVEVDRFLAGVVVESDSGIGLSIRDSSARASDRPIFASAEARVSSDFRTNMDVYLGGHRWTIEAFSLAAFEDWVSRLSTLFIALSGVAITLVGMMVLADSKTKQERAALLARETSESLRKSEAEIRELNAGLEAAVAARTASLEEANSELRAFSYTVSHDLRAPVRHVQSLASFLDEEHRGEFSEGARDYLNRIRDAADRMQTLIEEILRLASCNTVALRPQQVDLTALASEIVEEVGAQEREGEIRVSIQPGMEIAGDPAVLRTVMQNLLENAFKFTSKREVAEISVGLERGARGDAVYVRDNGVGFDMAKAEAIFQPFKRLHRESEYEGTGVGLATVRKMVRRHGGEIEVESAVDAGTTFHFTLDGSRRSLDLPDPAPATAAAAEPTLPLAR